MRNRSAAVQIRTGEPIGRGLESIANDGLDWVKRDIWLHTTMKDWTILLERLRTRWPQCARVPQRAPRIFPIEQSTPHVPRAYRALYTYLEHRYASVVMLTFEQIEALLGCALPAPARTEREWWTDTVDTQGHCAAWTRAGRTAAPNLSAGIVAFERPV